MQNGLEDWLITAKLQRAEELLNVAVAIEGDFNYTQLLCKMLRAAVLMRVMQFLVWQGAGGGQLQQQQ